MGHYPSSQRRSLQDDVLYEYNCGAQNMDIISSKDFSKLSICLKRTVHEINWLVDDSRFTLKADTLLYGWNNDDPTYPSLHNGQLTIPSWTSFVNSHIRCMENHPDVNCTYYDGVAFSYDEAYAHKVVPVTPLLVTVAPFCFILGFLLRFVPRSRSHNGV